MSYGCKHDPNQCCTECIKDLRAGNAIVIQTNLKPTPGESLESFAARVDQERLAGSGESRVTPAYVEPSLEEKKRIIRDPNEPAPVRKFFREQLYGRGGGGRRAERQDRALRETNLVSPSEATPLELLIRQAPSGRQRKRLRKLLQRTAKVAQFGGVTPLEAQPSFEPGTPFGR